MSFDVLTPLVLATKASRLVNTKQVAALGTGPSLSFAADEMPYSELLDALEIVNHTHAVLSSITLI